jgi:hypothetical protein
VQNHDSSAEKNLKREKMADTKYRNMHREGALKVNTSFVISVLISVVFVCRYHSQCMISVP